MEIKIINIALKYMFFITKISAGIELIFLFFLPNI